MRGGWPNSSFQESNDSQHLGEKSFNRCLPFVSLVYELFWHEACLAERAPYNDLKLLNLLQHSCEKCSQNSFQETPQVFSEHLIGLAFLTHVLLLIGLQRPPWLRISNVLKKLIIPSKRIESRTFNLGNLLESYVTSRISRLFDLFIDSGA